jgi:ATP-dependent Lon protease
VQYEFSEESRISPWIIDTLKPIQIARVDYDGYRETRDKFTTEEWIDLLMQSIGFEPSLFGRRSKLLQLLRLIPFVERNYNLIELGPKGTGKSHIYSEFSPHGQLISGGEITVPKLFVNNSNGRIGLVGYWDVVAFDEFAGREKTANKALVDIMKNYMANKQFSRGVNPMGAEASFAFVGNTDHNVPWMLKNTDLFEALPPQFHDSAFIDRLHAYLPGWEVDIIRGEMFTSGYGFIVDYLAEILRHLRAEDFSHRPDRYFTIPVQTHIRDRAAISKTMSGLLKLIFPNGGETEAEVEELLRFAIECRKRVKDQLLRIDSTFESADFHYIASDGAKRAVTTLEEEEFPQFYHRRSASDVNDRADQPEIAPISAELASTAAGSAAPVIAAAPAFVPKPGHVVFTENRKGISFDKIFGPWTDGASRIIITDPYIRKFHQARNVMELIEMLIRRKQPEDQVAVHLVTAPDDGNIQEQRECLDGIAEACTGTGVDFTWAFDRTGTIHARDITTDTGWKMVLDRGLDIFQPTPRKMNGFSLGERMQEHRMVKGFYVTYVEAQ